MPESRESGTLTPAEVVAWVRALPPQAIERLAEGPNPDPNRCHACGVLGNLSLVAPALDASNALTDWHIKPHDVPRLGMVPDPTRAGMIYGVAAALRSV